MGKSASILTAEDVRRLRELRKRGSLNTMEEAQFYGVAAETIRRAVRGETWRTVRAVVTPDDMEGEAQASLRKMQAAMARDRRGERMVEELSDEPYNERSKGIPDPYDN